MFRHAAGRRNHIYLFVAVVLSCKCNPFSIRRKFCEQFLARRRGKPHRHTARSRCRPQISRVAEHDFVAVNVRKPKQFGFRQRGRSQNEKSDKAKQNVLKESHRHELPFTRLITNHFEQPRLGNWERIGRPTVYPQISFPGCPQGVPTLSVGRTRGLNRLQQLHPIDVPTLSP